MMLSILLLIWLVLALPSVRAGFSMRIIARALFVSAAGILFPLIVFLLSAFLVPEWKGGCAHGWLDCFHLGKLTLLPLVLWATGALYAVEILNTKPPYFRTVVLGLFTGMITAGGCFVYGLIFTGSKPGIMSLWLLVPLYISVWNATRFFQAVQSSKPGPVSLALSFIGMIPFWVGGALWSRRVFESLPNNPPECFVVTAAARGHTGVVGPLFEMERNGKARTANQQLVTFWKCESIWEGYAPQTHRNFRRVYNRIGPVIARRLSSAWIADFVYISLKPVELVASLMVIISSAKSQPVGTKTIGIP